MPPSSGSKQAQIFETEDGNSMFLRNSGERLLNYTVQHTENRTFHPAISNSKVYNFFR
jgi:hypothetical protein